MAKIHKGENDLQKQANKYLTLAIIFWIPPIAYMYAFIFHKFHFDGLFHLTPAIFAFIGFAFIGKFNVLRSGIKGETNTAKALMNLPDTYEVFSSVKLTTKDGTAEFDHVVIGENGIFVVEVKNHNGTIEGNEEDQSWIQHKIGRKGGAYSKEMRNPVKQVRRQVFILSSYFKENGINVWIEGIVFFSNPVASVNVYTERTPVMTNSNELNYFITTYSSRQMPSESQLEKAKRLIS